MGIRAIDAGMSFRLIDFIIFQLKMDSPFLQFHAKEFEFYAR